MNYYAKATAPQLAIYSSSVRGSQSLPRGRICSPHLVRIHLSIRQRRLTCAKPVKQRQYQLPCFDNVEDVEKYTTGGSHPIHLGDTLKSGRYRVLHKLGYGRFATVWLVHDKLHGSLVSIKVLIADASRQQKELRLLRHLDENIQNKSWRGSIIAILDNFTVDGPNGTHLCYVPQVGGPRLSTISDSPGEMAGTRRLRAPVARSVARQLAKAVSLIHDVGIIHGGTLHSGRLEGCAT